MPGLADRIREAADEVGGLNKLADMIGVPRRTLGHWLQGRKPKPEALRDIARVAHVDLEWLLSGEGHKYDSALGRALRTIKEKSSTVSSMSPEEVESALQKAMEKLRASGGDASIFDGSDEPEVDEQLMEELAKIVTSVYREAKQHLPIEKVTVEATRLFNSLRQLVELDDAEGVRLALPLLRHKLKRRLDQASAEPGSGKRSAS